METESVLSSPPLSLDGFGKRLLLAKYEASAATTVSILFFVTWARIIRLAVIVFVIKNPEIKPIIDMAIDISKRKDPR
jgi:hypothetical protein